MPNSHNDFLEIAKISINDEHQHFCFKPEIMEDPIDWGYLLADFARLLASSYEESQGGNSHSVLARILQGFESELKSTASPRDLSPEPQIVGYTNCK